MFLIFSTIFLFISYVVYLINNARRKVEYKKFSLRFYCYNLIASLLVPSLFQLIILSLDPKRNIQINFSTRAIFYILILSPLIETFMVGGIYGLTRLFGSNKISNFMFFFLNAVFWPIIHVSKNFGVVLWYVFGFLYMSMLYCVVKTRHSELFTISFVTIIHFFANIGMLITLYYAA